ncbi:MAG: hypothetical protein JW716_05475 [Candidatus Aenigmarchaeota archaeon]|nr:hypothetical protein [Candidatus Aenigmarchaeota archaeon]
MTEISNNIIAGLLLIFIILNMIQTSIQITGVDNERVLGKVTVGFAGLCIIENATINDISNQTVLTQIPFYLDANTTPADANVFFYDTFPFFNITADGIINFTANESDIGVHDQYLRINDSCGNFIHERFVRFTISTSNLAPILDFIPDQNLTQNEFFTYDVNATDPNLDPLIFGDNSTFFNIDPYTGIIQINPQQEDVGNNSVLIYVYDDKYAIDQQIVNFEVVDVNDAPVLNPIGAQTAIINYTYYYDVNATDVDTTFPNTLTFGDNSTLFNINSTTGIIDFMAADGQNGTYSVNITVTDGLLWDWEVISFAVVYENHPPNITWWDPEEYELEMYEGDSLLLSIVAEDPDGTIPTAQWYLDGGVLTNAINYNYTYYSPVGSRGYHNLTVVVSDGELTDYHEWEILVIRREVETGGATGSTSTTPSPTTFPCAENWRCQDWEPCRVDGYQLRSCRDLNKCGTVIFKPETARNCTYYPQPSCEDGIQNCHHGGCEILADCGGPCPPCPTCNDGIRNQGEEGIDCGGPCPACIDVQKPVKGEERPTSYCGDNICGNNELFTCFADCSGTLAEYAIVVIIIFILIVLSYWYNEAALVALMKFKRIFLMAVGKKTAPVMSAKERVGTYTLIDLNRMKGELNQGNAQKIMDELSDVMRKFFSAAVHIGGEFTYIDLNEKAGELKIDDKTKKRISNFAMGMTKMEYSDEKASSSDVANLLHLAISIVESMTRTKTEKAVRVGKDIEIYNKNGTEEVHLEKKKEKTESPKTEKKKESRFSSFFKKQPEVTEVVKKETPPAEKKPDEKRSPLFVLNKPKKKSETAEKPAEAERKEIAQPEKLVAPQPEVEMSFEGIRKKINELIEESERLCRMEDYKKAKEFYHEARDLYDRIPKERRKDLTEETIKFIRLYNQIVSNL